MAYLLPPLPLGDDWAASVASVYAPQSPTVSFSQSASASPLASIASVSPLASRDKPLPEPPTNCSSPEPESGRGTRSDRPPEVPQSGTDRHRADHGRDHVYDDNDVEHDRYHKHGKKPSYDYDEYSYQFQPGYEPECETNQRRDEPPVEPLEDYALPLAPFRQRENYDYALILAKELCTLTRDASGLTVTSIHEVGGDSTTSLRALPHTFTHFHSHSVNPTPPHLCTSLPRSRTICTQLDHPFVL